MDEKERQNCEKGVRLYALQGEEVSPLGKPACSAIYKRYEQHVFQKAPGACLRFVFE